MAVSALAAAWAISLFVIAVLGWLFGRREGTFGPGSTAKPEVGATARLEQSGTSDERARIAAPPAPHIFDNMPPLESLRAEAQGILAAERVWDALPEEQQQPWLGDAGSDQ